MTNDLRARVALIIERDRARRSRATTVDGTAIEASDADRGTPRAGGPRRGLSDGVPRVERVSVGVAGSSAARPETNAPFEVREQRIALDDLGVQIVGRGACDPLLLAHLGLKGEAPRDWSDILFLDTETTGLAGGTGTYVFLIGLAYIADGELVLRQHLLRDIGAEREFVEHLKRELEPFRACASYNGKTFDLPLLRTRFVMTIRGDLTVDESHLDLLHPARRLWKDRFGSTTLRQLEESVLDDSRITDIPGSLIPDAYFHYLRKGDDKIIAPVLEHNARDVISLVRIADHVARAILAARDGRAPSHAPAAFALARVFERTGEAEAAFACYESAYFDGDDQLRVRLALRFARQLERRSEVERALRIMEALVELGLGSARWREQAASRVRRLTKKRGREAATAS